MTDQYDELKGPYNNVNSYSNNSNLKDYNKYCNNQLLNSEPNKPQIKGKENEKEQNVLENQQTFYTSEKAISKGIIENINEENEWDRGENQFQENFNDLPTEHPNQQESDLGINNIIKIESNNSHLQAINATNPQKPKKLIFNVITPIPKENKTIKRNIGEKNEEKKEIPPQIKKRTSLFKTEIADNSYDNHQYLNIKRKIDSLSDENYAGKGRLPHILKDNGVKGKHTKNAKDNLNKSIIHKCKDSFDKIVIKNECKEYPITLKDLTIKPQLGKNNIKDYNNFCRKSLYEIYIHSFPKNMKKLQKLEKIKGGNDINKETKASIIQLIDLENKNKKAKTKILYLLFKKTIFYDILNAFLFDRNIIKVDGIEIELKGFETYKDYFKDLAPERKEKVKFDLITNLEECGLYKFI